MAQFGHDRTVDNVLQFDVTRMAPIAMRFVPILFVAVLLLTANIARGAADSQATFEQAVALLNSQKYAEAIPLLQEVLKSVPESQGALWNLGIAAAEVGDHALALEAWTRYRDLAPNNEGVIAKLIQAYQGLGRFVERDKERESLFALHRSLPPEESAKSPFYCREQFRTEGTKVMALEFFQPTGPRQIFYRFEVLDDTGKESFFFSLGSYDLTTQIARELREISGDQRAYHIDKYQGATHWTYAHFNSLPTYDDVRAIVVDAMSGKAHPVSGSRR